MSTYCGSVQKFIPVVSLIYIYMYYMYFSANKDELSDVVEAKKLRLSLTSTLKSKAKAIGREVKAFKPTAVEEVKICSKLTSGLTG